MIQQPLSSGVCLLQLSGRFPFLLPLRYIKHLVRQKLFLFGSFFAFNLNVYGHHGNCLDLLVDCKEIKSKNANNLASEEERAKYFGQPVRHYNENFDIPPVLLRVSMHLSGQPTFNTMGILVPHFGKTYFYRSKDVTVPLVHPKDFWIIKNLFLNSGTPEGLASTFVILVESVKIANISNARHAKLSRGEYFATVPKNAILGFYPLLDFHFAD